MPRPPSLCTDSSLLRHIAAPAYQAVGAATRSTEVPGGGCRFYSRGHRIPNTNAARVCVDARLHDVQTWGCCEVGDQDNCTRTRPMAFTYSTYTRSQARKYLISHGHAPLLIGRLAWDCPLLVADISDSLGARVIHHRRPIMRVRSCYAVQ